VVNNDLCIGCGVCVDACPSNALDVTWNDYGFLSATTTTNACNADGVCIKVCPFNPDPAEQHKDEDKLAEIYLQDASKHHPKIGRYEGIYAGYSKKYRATSSSGGIATYVYDRLFSKGLIDHVVTVGESSAEGVHYAYRIISNKEELITTSKTRYHPVTLAHALKTIKSLEGKVAVSGVACFIKAVRLAQANDPVLNEKITFLTGIICGGVKSRFFTDYLASRSGAEQGQFKKPEYRVKDPDSTASDYGFSCENKSDEKTHFIKMREVGDMWGSGLFKANACDYCDDITTELADISLGDAWLPPYNADGLGNNVIICRTAIAESLINQGVKDGEIKIDQISSDKLLSAQQGNIRHRIDGYSVRLKEARKNNIAIPFKRSKATKPPLDMIFVQKLRRLARKKSLSAWKKAKSAEEFDKSMQKNIFVLKLITRLSAEKRKLEKILKWGVK
jgi:coenzyme F420-reducing hydrogenase beta subunit